MQEHAATGETVVVVETYSEPVELIGLTDVPCHEAAATVRALQSPVPGAQRCCLIHIR